RESAARMQGANNLKQIGLALHSYHDDNNSLPPASMRLGPGGMPLPPGADQSGGLSWRVHILPYLGERTLYNQFKLDEPWDSPNNSKLLPLMPKVYALPRDPRTQPGYTSYQVCVSDPQARPQSAFSRTRPGRSFAQISDGTSNTIMVVEAATAVPWTKPDDIPFDPNNPLPALGNHWSGGTQVLLCAG